jgi:hypothetical protein
MRMRTIRRAAERAACVKADVPCNCTTVAPTTVAQHSRWRTPEEQHARDARRREAYLTAGAADKAGPASKLVDYDFGFKEEVDQ